MIGRSRFAITWKTIILVYMTTNAVHCGAPTMMDELYNSVFENYSSKALPYYSSNDTLTVQLAALTTYLDNFDELSGVISLSMIFHLKWMDPRLSWNSSNYNNITSVLVNPEDLWRPQLYILESVKVMANIDDTTLQARLYSDGKIEWMFGKEMELQCPLSIDSSYHSYTCHVQFLNLILHTNEMKLIPGEKSILFARLNHDIPWELVHGTLSNCKKSHVDNIPCLKLTFYLNHHYSFLTVFISIPLLLFTVIFNILYLIPASSGQGTSASLTIMLSFVVFMGTLHDVVPKSSRNMSSIHLYTCFLLSNSFFSSLFSVVSQRMLNTKSPIPYHVRKIVYYAKFNRLKQVKKNNPGVNNTEQQDSSGRKEHETQTIKNPSSSSNNKSKIDLQNSSQISPEEHGRQKTESSNAPSFNTKKMEQHFFSRREQNDMQMTENPGSLSVNVNKNDLQDFSGREEHATQITEKSSSPSFNVNQNEQQDSSVGEEQDTQMTGINDRMVDINHSNLADTKDEQAEFMSALTWKDVSEMFDSLCINLQFFATSLFVILLSFLN